MSRSPGNEAENTSKQWLQARYQLSDMIKQGRSFSGHERNCCFLNTHQGSFATISAVSGLDFPDDGRAISVVDWDQDGDLDLWVSNRNAPRLRLMRNDYKSENNFIALRLVGNGTTSSRDAVGARIEVVLDDSNDRRLARTLRAGEGFLAQSSKSVHFGLGDQQSLENVLVHWPGGQVKQYGPLKVNRRHVITQGQADAEQLSVAPSATVLCPGQSELPRPTRQARVPLFTRLPMPRLSYRTWDGQQSQIEFGRLKMEAGTVVRSTPRAVPAAVPDPELNISQSDSGQPIVLTLWASWCQPCLDELEQWSLGADKFRRAGVKVVALSVDELDGQPASSTTAADVARRIGGSFETGLASAEAVDDLQNLHNDLLVMRKPLPIPTSFLVDARGNLSVVYMGPTSVDEILADAVLTASEYVDRYENSACIPGRSLDHPRVAASARMGELRTRFRVAASFRNEGRLREALAMFEDLLRFDPECADAHVQIGAIHATQGDLASAAVHCEQAIRLNPNLASIHNTFGNIRARQGQPEEARGHFERAIYLKPDFAEAYNNLGTLLASRRDYRAAERQLLRAIDLEPDLAETHNNLGSVYASLGNIAKAAEHYAKAIEVDSEFAEAHNNLGTMYARRGIMAKAIINYERALEIDPDYEEAKNNLKRARNR